MINENFEQMDSWTSEEVAKFKEAAKIKEIQPREKAIGFLVKTAAKKPGRVIAEGDSWFDYLPGTDLIDCLKNHYDYDIEHYAKAGDTLENMIFGTGINKHFQRVAPQIETVLRRIKEVQPKVFLFSGGGNDVAGDEFESYLNHKNSGLPALRKDFVENMINIVFRQYFTELIKRVAAVSPATQIVAHGYGHTFPTGESVDFLFFTFAGPWLRPALARKGIFEATEQQNLVFELIDKYNEMLREMAHVHANFHHIDLRPILNPASDWANELHLKNSAYARSAAQIHDKIQSLL
ncbi:MULTISPECIES: SGNH/GDSL hydrolase family protein [Nitrosomonas]|uniref:GDSL-like lipase/acylhydrolase family protein n=1 Tax=Nitrosomonas communis TaxID=44574 RepID=A0A0F7KFX2_9PROT|nr:MULTISPECIES: SGNH/GDSL hydrolase family protein [Nitrosomonas]AKH37749.1 hypothetical protein AAW31_07935 [Nitrosomonas communis]TYP86084.1 GDSL-like lipase/acylhydrolase family protein [Nitrosomonas communis]UVS63077.1 SGNH/GDSL hydrolase family protein [Nitrosomonas sp. PLL12]